jgi:hypothetical protein
LEGNKYKKLNNFIFEKYKLYNNICKDESKSMDELENYINENIA